MSLTDDLRDGPLDELDLKILDELLLDARLPNAQLALRVGVAASTAHQRVRSLIDRGIITGFLTSVDQAKLGHEIQALVGVTLRAGSRQASIEEFAQTVRRMPEVLQVFFVGGGDDFMIHIAARNSSAVRRFVITLSGQASVASTRTSLIFDYHRNGVAASFE
jgi:DNA-binding Lrp family transcriptional regulator